MTEFRLPTNVKPRHYNLTIKTDLEDLTFEGFASIDLDIVEDTSTIAFNSSTLELDDVTLHSEHLKTEHTQIASDVDEKNERVSVKFSTVLPAKSKATLKLGFKGTLSKCMMGYYQSSTTIDGKQVNYALTQFEPTSARKAFPSWDEPALKATYDITLISRADTVNLSNMPVVSEKPFTPSSEDDPSVGKLAKAFSKLKTSDSEIKWKITKFATTPLISSYLVAWANGPFEFVEGSYTSPLSGKTRPVRIYATKDIIHQTQFALDVNVRSLPIYEKVFDVEYPLPKLDVLVAHDFDAGAMENWGLITGRTSAYLIDPEKSDIKAKKRVAGVASHEVAHQWFGNIVTMEWWDYLYLNEGFATLMGEVVIMDKLFPEYDASTEFIEDHLQRALELDSKRSSHPIEVPCPDANQINQIFDALSYSKAGSVLRMLADFVGEDVFLKGVSIYLKKLLYKNSVTKDLWDGVSESSRIEGSCIDVNKMMAEWILKIGFPVVTVTEGEGSITVRQNRYLATGDVKPDEDETLWQIPLNILTTNPDGKAVIDRTLVLTEREGTYKIDTSRPWKLNAGTTGVYRVAYTPDRISILGKQAAEKGSPFSLPDRIGLVSDAQNLGKSGYIKTSTALELIDALKNEEEYLVWNGIASALRGISSVWWEQPDQVQENLKAFERSLWSPLVKRLGWEFSDKDSVAVRQLRSLAIERAALSNDKNVVAKLTSFFKLDADGKLDDTAYPSDLERIVFINAVKKGGRREWEVLKAVYDNPKTPTQKISACLAMTRTQQDDIIKETFEYMEGAKDQDYMYWFHGLNANIKTRRAILAYLKENFEKIYKRYEGNFSLGYFIKFALESFGSLKDLEETEAFFKNKDTSKYKLPLLQSCDAIRANKAWLERSTTDVEEWLVKWADKY